MIINSDIITEIFRLISKRVLICPGGYRKQDSPIHFTTACCTSCQKEEIDNMWLIHFVNNENPQYYLDLGMKSEDIRDKGSCYIIIDDEQIPEEMLLSPEYQQYNNGVTSFVFLDFDLQIFFQYQPLLQDIEYLTFKLKYS